MPIYLNLETVEGESKARGHQGWIELNSCLWETTRTSTREQHDTRDDSDQNATPHEATCTREADSTSVTLSRLSQTGQPQRATVDFVDWKGRTLHQFWIHDAFISSHSFSNAASGPPVETFTLSYTKKTLII
jgi:type VI protein secretion system component Hcp